MPFKMWCRSLMLGCGVLFSSCHDASIKTFSDSTSHDHQNHVLRINIGTEPQSLDPRKARDLGTINVLHMLFEGLTRIDKNQEVQLALAKCVAISEDKKTYTFYLKEAKWTNGDPVTAEDFVFTWKKSLDPQFVSSNAFQLYVIKNAQAAKNGQKTLDEVGVKALGAKMLQVELEHPVPYFLELVSSPIFFPVNQTIDKKHPDWAENSSLYVSNGPFFLKEWKHHDCISVEKSGFYWDSAVIQIPRIELYMMSENTGLEMFEKDELDWVGSPLSTIPLDAICNLKQKKLLETKPLLGTCFIRLNVDALPLKDKNIRRAFAYAIDRKIILKYVTHDTQIPATALVPEEIRLTNETYFKDGDIIEAKRLFKKALDKSKIDIKNFPEITLTFINEERPYLIAQAIQQQWFDAFGIRVKLENVERKVYYDRIGKQDFQMAIGSWIADFNDPLNFLEIFKYKKASTNNTLWENETYISHIDHAIKTKEIDERRRSLYQAENILLKEMPIIPLFHYNMLYVKKRSLKDVGLSSMGVLDFKWAYLEEKGEDL